MGVRLTATVGSSDGPEGASATRDDEADDHHGYQEKHEGQQGGGHTAPAPLTLRQCDLVHHTLCLRDVQGEIWPPHRYLEKTSQFNYLFIADHQTLYFWG